MVDRQECCMSCTEWLTEELQLENLSPKHQQPEVFVTTQWTRSQAWYVIYRWMLALGLVGWGITDVTIETQTFYSTRPGLWFTFATNLAFISIIFTHVYSAILVSCHSYATYRTSLKPRRDSHGLAALDLSLQIYKAKGMPLKLQFFWIIYSASISAILSVSFSFWTFLTVLDHENYLNTSMSQVKHTAAALITLLDLFIGGVPVRVLHVIYPIISGVIYVIFSAVYYVTGGRGPGGMTYIYPVLSWDAPGVALLTSCLEILLLLIMHFVTFLVFRFRLCVQKKCLPNTQTCCSSQEEQTVCLMPEEMSNYNSTEGS